ncbi:remorin 1.4 isoform X2 [Rhododendron vialii]|uniref:remorin 1.4 isoform X2 n=1 Tax=Rhododendron vialii TaxID=182163 RepID=UPI00265E4CD2|nr:remorin 1.4 isoform X2 [Rhododendron vialii]
MESWIRQTRVRFYGVGDENKEESNDNRDRSLQPQKIQSFKGEKKKSQTWLRRQFSRQTSQDFDSSNGCEYAAAVAAAAYAINLLEEFSIAEQKRKSEGADTSLTKIKSRTEDTSTRVRETGYSGRISRRLSDKSVPVSAAKDEKIPEKALRPALSIKKTASFADKPLDTTAIPEKAVHPAPSIKKTASFADKPLDTTASRKPESVLPKIELPSAKPPAFQPTDFKRQSSTRPGIEETEADAWENAEMAKIEERYDKLSTTILDWESKKKAKAKRQRDKTESQLERRRAKAMKHYRSDMENIDKISGGARAQAEENRRNEEFKVKEKANKIRSTGKIPPTCLCF